MERMIMGSGVVGEQQAAYSSDGGYVLVGVGLSGSGNGRWRFWGLVWGDGWRR